MNDTVRKLMRLADDYADWALAEGNEHPTYVRTRQALEAELTRLFTPLSDDKPVHKHEWFRTGAMAPGEHRCITCGVWSNPHGIT